MDPLHDCSPHIVATMPRQEIPTRRPPLLPLRRVGQRLRSNITRWPTGSEYCYGPSGHELTLFRPNITSRVIDDLWNGSTEFALILERPLIVLAYRFGESIPWESAPYCWHLQPEFRRVVPSVDLKHQVRALLWVTLVGTGDGIVHAQRALTLSPEFTGSLHQAIRDQAFGPFHPKQCVAAINSGLLVDGSFESRLAKAAAHSSGNA